MSENHIVIAIDGPAGAGKSTVAKKLADRLCIFYLDTGAMYRALTLKALEKHLDLADEDQLTEMTKNTLIVFEKKDSNLQVLLDGRDVTEDIRSIEVTNNAFYLARTKGVREELVSSQQEIGKKQSIVAEGRDTTTVVFPHATKKFFLDAKVEERLQRRYDELQEKGKSVEKEELLKDIKDRDNKDSSREVGPLKKAEDAIIIDSSSMSADEVVEQLLIHINETNK